MKNTGSSIKIGDRPRLRGDLELRIQHSESGKERRINVRNQITYDGLNSMLWLWAQDGVVASDYQMQKLVPGTNATPPTRGDLAVLSPVPLADQITLFAPNRTVSTGTGELIITGTLTNAQANGFALAEIGVTLGNGQLFARQVHPTFNKTAAFTLTYTWRFAVTS
jgi:hypothetical protein